MAALMQPRRESVSPSKLSSSKPGSGKENLLFALKHKLSKNVEKNTTQDEIKK